MVISQQEDALAGIDLLLELVEEEPEFTSSYVGLGFLYQSVGHYDRAREYYMQALEKIVDQLDTIDAELAPGRQVSASQISELQGDRSRLEQERDTLLQRLDSLPDPE